MASQVHRKVRWPVRASLYCAHEMGRPPQEYKAIRLPGATEPTTVTL